MMFWTKTYIPNVFKTIIQLHIRKFDPVTLLMMLKYKPVSRSDEINMKASRVHNKDAEVIVQDIFQRIDWNLSQDSAVGSNGYTDGEIFYLKF